MSVLTSADNAQLAQEVVVTTLQSICGTRGSQATFAAKAGITPVYLSYILNRKRMPRMKMARRLSELMPLSTQDRRTWLGYVEQYWHSRVEQIQEINRITDDDLDAAVLEVTLAHRQAAYSNSPARVHQSCELTISLGEKLISVFPIKSDPTAYLEVCGLVYEMHTFQANHVRALGIAKHMQFIASAVAPTDNRNLDGFAVQRFNAARLEIVTLNQLGLVKTAYTQSLKLAADKVLLKGAEHLKPMLYWDCMNAMASLPRSSIREARSLVQEAWTINEKTNPSHWATYAHLLISRSFAEVCISHGNYREAEELLRDIYDRLDKIQHLGLLHRVMFLRTYGRLLWEKPEHDIGQWRHVIGKAVRIAIQAGLHQELNLLKRDYGDQIANIQELAP